MLERMSSNRNFHALLMEVQNRAKMESCVTGFLGNILSINFFWLFTYCYQSLTKHQQKDLHMNTHSHFTHGKHKTPSTINQKKSEVCSAIDTTQQGSQATAWADFSMAQMSVNL